LRRRETRVAKWGKPFTITEVCRLVSEIGQKARVVVDKASGKFASAHDLRRSFGTRWAKLLMPAVLRQWMRHADIATTMAYYVPDRAKALATKGLRIAEIATALGTSERTVHQYLRTRKQT
jgi:integrase